MRGLRLLCALLAGVLCLPTVRAACSDLPAGPVRWIVTNTTGSAYDIYARAMVPQMETHLGRDVVVVNISGGGGIVGAREVAAAAPDGGTLGLLNGAGLITAALVGRSRVPRIVEDFHILGRASPMRHVWATAADGTLTDLQTVRNSSKLIVFGVRNVASTSFVSLSVGAWALQLNHAFVVGYASNRGTRLALARGEVDVVSMDLSSGQRQIKNGLLRPIAQMSVEPIQHALAEGVPTMLAALESGDAARIKVVQGLYQLLGSNRLFVAPPDLPPHLSACLQTAITKTFEHAATTRKLELRAAPVNFADAQQTLADLRALNSVLPEIAPIVRSAVARIR